MQTLVKGMKFNETLTQGVPRPSAFFGGVASLNGAVFLGHRLRLSQDLATTSADLTRPMKVMLDSHPAMKILLCAGEPGAP